MWWEVPDVLSLLPLLSQWKKSRWSTESQKKEAFVFEERKVWNNCLEEWENESGKYGTITYLPTYKVILILSSLPVPVSLNLLINRYFITKFGFGDILQIYFEISLLHDAFKILIKYFISFQYYWCSKLIHGSSKTEQRHWFKIAYWPQDEYGSTCYFKPDGVAE